MSDIYNRITAAETSQVRQLAEVLELRAAHPQQRAMRNSYLAEIDFPAGAEVVEVGCGTGAVARTLAAIERVKAVIGIDPSPVLLDRAREFAADQNNLSFREACAEALPLADASQDLVVFHTSLCHLSAPETALREAFRVLRPDGWLAVFDGDYAATTLAGSDLDPLQLCAAAFRRDFIHDSYLARRTPALAATAGFVVQSFRSHNHSESADADYLLSIVDRGAAALEAAGEVGPELAAALKNEARQRAATGRFFGQVGYTSLIARKPA